jgi:tetratricopeptide (TPR) repeat protein
VAPPVVAVPAACVMRAVRAILTVVLGYAAWEAARLGYADWAAREKTGEGLKRAIRIAPENARNYALLGRLLVSSDAAASAAAFEQAVGRNRWDSDSWIELGLWAEAAGDGRRAEQLLGEAARVDALYLPRWTLANYYFRRGDTRQFQQWVREAARMGYGDLSPLFRLVAMVAGETGNAAEWLQLDNPRLMANYLSFAISSGRLHEVAPCARKLAWWGRREDQGVVLAACDALAGRSMVDDALRVWEDACRKGLVDLSPDEATRGGVTNGEFRHAPLGAGFDWRIPRHEGVEVGMLDPAKTLRIRLTGNQPEHCELLAQMVPVGRGGDFSLEVEYRTRGLARESGLAWRVSDMAAADHPEWLSSESWTTAKVPFRIPDGAKLVRLALWYARAPGTVRADGEVAIRAVRLNAAEGLPATPKAAVRESGTSAIPAR